MKENKYLIKQAQEAYNKGDYNTAIDFYEKAIIEYPELATFYNFTIKNILSKHVGNIKNNEISNINDLYKIVDNYTKNCIFTNKEKMPLVSVIMTTYNDENTIEQSIISILRQSYTNLEIVIIDDCSTDDTWKILERLNNKNHEHKHQITIQRLNDNLGTYFAKNYGIYLSKGEYIFFQDADDISHPERIRLYMEEFFKNPDILVVRGSFSRVIFPEGKILATNKNGENKIRLGYITLGLKKKVFNEIGYFDCATIVSDDEFIHRIKKFYKKELICDNHLPLYYAMYRNSSLICSLVQNDPYKDNFLKQKLPIAGEKYVTEFKKCHNSIEAKYLKKFFKFPTIRNSIQVCNEITKLSNPKIPVIFSLCSSQQNYDSLKIVLDSLINQTDIIYLFLETNDVNEPIFLQKYKPKLIIKFLNSNKKYSIFTPKFLLDGNYYFFTASDNLKYPPDYVNTLIKRIEFYNKLTIIGIDGFLLAENPIDDIIYRYHFTDYLEKDKLVNILNINSIACHSSCLRGIDYEHFTDNRYMNLYFAIFCKNNLIPMINISKHKNWVTSVRNFFNNYSMEDYVYKKELLSQLYPSGYKGIYEILVNSVHKNNDTKKLYNLLPCLWQGLK